MPGSEDEDIRLSRFLRRGAPGQFPGLAVVGFIWAMGSYLFELKDEYVRLLEVRKALIATALTLGVSATWGILEIYTNVPRLAIFWVFPIWCVGLAIGGLVNRLTLGAGGGCP